MEALIESYITEENFPFRYDIIGKSKESLLYRKEHTQFALTCWKENRYKARIERQLFNINYFEVELKIIEKELIKYE